MDCDDRMLVATAAAAVATLIAALVALFLRELRSWLRPPQLLMSLSKPDGIAVEVDVIELRQAIPVKSRREMARYYHLRIENPRRKADAVHNVELTLLRIDKKHPDGAYHEAWSGDVPLGWRNETEDTRRRIVGTWGDADLCNVLRDKWLELPLRIVPSNLPKHYRADEAPYDLVLTVQARGDEVDSEVQRWRVFWDGKWADGDKEMLKHFHVTRWEA